FGPTSGFLLLSTRRVERPACLLRDPGAVRTALYPPFGGTRTTPFGAGRGAHCSIVLPAADGPRGVSPRTQSARPAPPLCVPLRQHGPFRPESASRGSSSRAAKGSLRAHCCQRPRPLQARCPVATAAPSGACAVGLAAARGRSLRAAPRVAEDDRDEHGSLA